MQSILSPNNLCLQIYFPSISHAVHTAFPGLWLSVYFSFSNLEQMRVNKVKWYDQGMWQSDNRQCQHNAGRLQPQTSQPARLPGYIKQGLSPLKSKQRFITVDHSKNKTTDWHRAS